MATFLAGFNAKATVDGAFFNFATYRCRAAGIQHDVSNSEGFAGNSAIIPSQLGQVGRTDSPTFGTVFESRLPGLLHMEVTVRQATFDLSANPFLAPINLIVNHYYEVDVLYIPTGGPSWFCPSLLINDIDGDGDVRGLQPVSFSGMSDGAFFLPGQLLPA